MRTRTFQTAEVPVRPPEAPFIGVVESFLRSRHDLKPWARRSYEKSLKRIAKRCTTIADFGADLLNDYITEKMDAGHQTIAHHDGTAARQLAKWLVKSRILQHDPIASVVVPAQPRKRRRPYTDQDAELILTAARQSQHSERDVSIVAIALACGLRKDEIRAIRWPEDVDLAKRVLYVRTSKTEAGVRQVPISSKVIPLIDSYVKDWRPSQASGPLFLNNHGDPFSYDGFSQIFRRIKTRLPKSIDFKIHRARNTALTNWRRAGVDVARIAKFAGHSDIAHTDRYLGDITPEEVAQVPDAFAMFLRRKAV